MFSETLSATVHHLKQVYGSLQAGRASAALVEDIQVESYGSMMPLKNVANISCPDARTLRVEPWDKALVGAIEKAIVISDIGITPQNMGQHILLPIPPMTEERRKKLVKIIYEEAENAHISIRNARQEEMKRIKSDEELSEDEQKRQEKRAQELVDEKNREIDALAKKKETDILTV